MSAALVFGLWGYGVLRIEKLESKLEPGKPIGVIQGNIVQKLGRSEEELWDAGTCGRNGSA